MKVPARRYAAALFEAVGDVEANVAVLAELGAVESALRAVPRALQTLAHATVAPAVADGVMAALGEVCSPTVARFLRVLVERGRMMQLGQVLDAYRRRVEDARGVQRARFQSARELADGEVLALRQALVRRFGEVEVTPEVRSDLLGGVRVVVGDRVLDGSVAAHLMRLRRVLAAARD